MKDNYDLIKHYEQGIKDERERIIKLLEEMPYSIYQAVARDGIILESISMPKVLNRDDVIALIKGEQND